MDAFGKIGPQGQFSQIATPHISVGGAVEVAEGMRLVAIDVDGTLLDSAGTIRPRVARSIEAARSAGCLVVLATGRRLQSARPLARQLGISTLILVDGAVIYDLEAETALCEWCLAPSVQQSAVELFRGADLPPILLESPAADARIFAGPRDLDNPETAVYLERYARQGNTVVRVPMEDLPRIPRVVSVLGMGPEERLACLVGQTQQRQELSTVFWRPWAAGYRASVVALGRSGVSKGQALIWLADHLRIARDQTMAIGDYDNDASMVQLAGLGVAMGNAVATVKSVARAIVADNDHDGVAEALETWVLSRDESRWRPGAGELLPEFALRGRADSSLEAESS